VGNTPSSQHVRQDMDLKLVEVLPSLYLKSRSFPTFHLHAPTRINAGACISNTNLGSKNKSILGVAHGEVVRRVRNVTTSFW